MKSYIEPKPIQDDSARKIVKNELIVYAGSYPITDINSPASLRRDGYEKIGLADSAGPIIDVKVRFLVPFELENLSALIANHLKLRSERPKYILINGAFVDKGNLVRVGQINECLFQSFKQCLEEKLKTGK